MKLRKLDMRGFSHDVGLVLFVVIFAIAGVGYLVASHAESCTPVSGEVSSAASSTPCQPTSGPVSSPVSAPGHTICTAATTLRPGGCFTVCPNSKLVPLGQACPSAPVTLAPGEQLSQPPQRRPAQYLHVCSIASTTYISQGGPNYCLPGGALQFNYDPSVPGTYYNIPCSASATSGSLLRYVYISSSESCPSGTAIVVPGSGEQLSQPPQRRPAQYLHVCNSSKITYVAQGMPNCLPGGALQFNYDPSVPGTYYNIPCSATNSTSPRYVYISQGESCPSGTMPVNKTQAGH